MPTYNLRANHSQRTNTRAGWESLNPILPAGQIGVEIGLWKTYRMKIGDGVNTWNNLPYFGDPFSVTVTDYKSSTNSWTDAFRDALNDPAVSIFGVEPGTYNLDSQILATVDGKKMVGLGAYASENKIRFQFATANTSGIWFQVPGRVANLSFTSTVFTAASAQNLLRFERIPAYTVGENNVHDMDSSVNGCNFSGFKKHTPGAPADQYLWGNAIRYNGRNLELSECNFSDCTGTCLALDFNPTTTDGTGTALTNDHQQPFYGHRKTRITHNLVHIGDGARFIHVSGTVALRGADVCNNVLDIGGQFLYCDGAGGVVDSFFNHNVCQHNKDSDPERSAVVYFKTGQVRNVDFIGNVFTGSDDINGIGGTPTVSDDSRYPEFSYRFASACTINGLNILGGTVGHTLKESIKFFGAASGVNIGGGLKVRRSNLQEAPSITSAAFNFGGVLTGANIGNVSWDLQANVPLMDFAGQAGSQVNVFNHLSNSTASWVIGDANLDVTCRIDYGGLSGGRVARSSSLTRNSATLSVDPVLQIAVRSGARYAFTYGLYFNTTAAADFQFRIDTPTTTTFRETRQTIDPAGAVGGAGTNAANAIVTVASASGGNGYVTGQGFLEPSANGTLSISWAQGTNTPGDNTNLLPGSFLTLERVK
jgi:hypothetical protein